MDKYEKWLSGDISDVELNFIPALKPLYTSLPRDMKHIADEQGNWLTLSHSREEGWNTITFDCSVRKVSDMYHVFARTRDQFGEINIDHSCKCSSFRDVKHKVTNTLMDEKFLTPDEILNDLDFNFDSDENISL